MGKAKIISGGDKGLYNIELIEQTTRITADIAKINARLPLLDKAIADALTAQSAAQADYAAKRAALDTAIGKYILGEVKKTDVESAQNAYTASLKALKEKSFSYSLLLQEKESKTKQKALLEKIPLTHTVDGVWCADLTEDLEAGEEVGTIEPNGEPDGDIIIYPEGEYEEFDEQLQPVMASTPAGYFLNMARFPGWQRWKPTYRIGTITALYSGEDYCDVSLDAALSSIKELNINQASSLTRVPVTYMTCNAGAFTVGDRVVVEFTDQKWTTPKVIGFEDHPKPCGGYSVLIVSSSLGYKKSVLIWTPEGNPADTEDLGFPNPCDYENAAFTEWYDGKTEDTEAKNLYTQARWFREPSDVPSTVIYPGYPDAKNEIPAICEPLTAGMKDYRIVRMLLYTYYNASWNWNADALGLGQTGETHISACGYTAYNGERGPCTVSCQRAATATNAEENFGFRIELEETFEHWRLSGSLFQYKIASVYSIYGPDGLLDTVTFWSDKNDINGTTTYYGWRHDYIGFPNSSSSETFVGKENTTQIVNVMVMHYTPVTYVKNTRTLAELSMVPDSNRVYHVYAQSLKYEDGSIISRGNDAKYEAKIIEAFELAYDLNGFESSRIVSISLSLLLV